MLRILAGSKLFFVAAALLVAGGPQDAQAFVQANAEVQKDIQPPIIQGPLGFNHRWSKANNTPGYDLVAANPTDYEFASDLGVRTDGKPVMVWEKHTVGQDSDDLWLAYWDGSKWRGMANPNGPDNVTNSAEMSGAPSLMMIGNTPVIAWAESAVDQWGNELNPKIMVVRWDNGYKGFTGAAPDVISTDQASNRLPSLSINPATNKPGVAWAHGTQIFFRQWNGSAWVGKASSAPDWVNGSDVVGNYPVRLGFASDGTPHATWMYEPTPGGNSHIYHRYWNGSSWRGYASAASDIVSAGWQYNYAPSMVMDSAGRPVIVWATVVGPDGYTALFLRRWSGSAWVGMQGQASADLIISSEIGVGKPSLALGADGKPGVAWYGASLDPDPFYSRWNGSAWVGLNSAVPEPLTEDDNEVADVRLRFAPNGKPMVSWTQETTPMSSVSDVAFTRWF